LNPADGCYLLWDLLSALILMLLEAFVWVLGSLCLDDFHIYGLRDLTGLDLGSQPTLLKDMSCLPLRSMCLSVRRSAGTRYLAWLSFRTAQSCNSWLTPAHVTLLFRLTERQVMHSNYFTGAGPVSPLHHGYRHGTFCVTYKVDLRIAVPKFY